MVGSWRSAEEVGGRIAAHRGLRDMGASRPQVDLLGVRLHVSGIALVMRNRPEPTKFPIHMDHDFSSQSN